MPNVTFAWSDGHSETIDAELNNSLMFAAVTNGIDGIDAECGGGLVCGTCHVHVGAAWFDKVGKPSPGEEDILDGVSDVCPTSRLACQITMTSELEGLTVTIPSNR